MLRGQLQKRHVSEQPSHVHSWPSHTAALLLSLGQEPMILYRYYRLHEMYLQVRIWPAWTPSARHLQAH